MSHGLMCLKCRKYIKTEIDEWACLCVNPVPSTDGVTSKALQSSDTKERNLRQELYDTANRRVAEQLTPWPKQPLDNGEPDITKPPCLECGAMTAKEAETKCICGGDKDDCHGCELWPDSGEE